ncbi:MAG: class I SAM-dependent methyltransferase [Burkholderiaceae bacterium]
MNFEKLSYAAGGLFKRIGRSRMCPSCKCDDARRVDRKGFHDLFKCSQCALQYRWPYETAQEMAHFYQRRYRQSGLTTDLPNADTLKRLMEQRFRGTEKDFSRVIDLLASLSIPEESRILDFGANWGYGVWQFREAGFDAVGYELSTTRAAFSSRLDVEVFSEWNAVENRGPFDVVFSSHVLEHTPDPAAALRRKAKMVAPGGLLIAYFPSGSETFRRNNPTAFHRLWGRVHPVMLDGMFVREVLSDWPLAIGAHCAGDLGRLRTWDRETSWSGNLGTSEMLIVAASPIAA